MNNIVQFKWRSKKLESGYNGDAVVIPFRRRVDLGMVYYCIFVGDNGASIIRDIETFSRADNIRWKLRNYFLTREEAEAALKTLDDYPF